MTLTGDPEVVLLAAQTTFFVTEVPLSTEVAVLLEVEESALPWLVNNTGFPWSSRGCTAAKSVFRPKTRLKASEQISSVKLIIGGTNHQPVHLSSVASLHLQQLGLWHTLL